MKETSLTKYALAAGVLALTGVLTTLISFGAGAAQARQAATMPVFASVNVQQILNESKARKNDTETLNNLVQGLRQVMQQLQEGGARFLSEPEIKELATLMEKDVNKTANDTERKRMAELEGKGQFAARDKRQLESNANPTDADKKRYTELNDAEQKGIQTIKNLADDFAKRVDARETELNNKTVLAIKGVINQVAKQKGATVVFDSQVAIYTSNDLTEEVVKQINK